MDMFIVGLQVGASDEQNQRSGGGEGGLPRSELEPEPPSPDPKACL